MVASKRQVVVVTGATAGIGRAVVREYAKRGAAIALIARGEDGLAATAREVEELGGTALICRCDVGRALEIEQAAERIDQELGPVDVWINNAMVSMFSLIKDMTPTEFRRITDVTYLGAVYGTLAALKRMLPRNEGVIVQVGSLLGRRSLPLQSAYCAAKQALYGFSESLRVELLHTRSRVKVTVVDLPAVNTPQFSWARARTKGKPQPIGRVYQPEVAAQAIVYAADHPRRREAGASRRAARGVAPKILERVFARRGVERQQRKEPDDPLRADNLWVPVPGDHGAHGEFDDVAKSKSVELWADKNRGWLAAGLAVLATLFLAFRRKRP